MRRSLVILALVAGAAVAAAGCAGRDGEAEATGEGPARAAPATTADPAGGPGPGGVRIRDFAFAPRTVAVQTGQQVTWAHRDAGVVHAVAADKGGFRSGDLEEGEEFSHRFPAAGTFAYHCAIHPDMRGTVRVGG